MAGLKPFREIPQNLRDWTRWMRAQDIPDAAIPQTSVDSTELSNIQLTAYEVTHQEATLQSNAATFDYAKAQSWYCDLQPAAGGNVTLTLMGGPSEGTYGEMNIRIVQDSTARTITWAGGTFQWAGGVQPVMSPGNDALDIFHFQTIDKGDTWIGSVLQDVS